MKKNVRFSSFAPLSLSAAIVASAFIASALLAPALFAPALLAQDSRHVTEPVLPPACTVLDAHLKAGGDGLAAADETKLDSERIQKALDGCAKGHGVELRARAGDNAFLTGPIQLRPGVTLIVDKGVTLFASRDAALYDTSPGSCGVVRKTTQIGFSDPIAVHEIAMGWGCKPLILANDAPGAGIMGDGTIDGRGNQKMLGKNLTWWGLGMSIKNKNMDRFCFRLIAIHHSNNFTLYRITLKDAPQFHVTYDHGDGFTVWGIKINTPERVNGVKASPNTDGIDPGIGAKDITITHSYIRDGDDNVAFTGGLSNATVSHNHFYWGHGMSIGSVVTKAGVSKVRVYDLSLDGPDNGIRLKSSSTRGGVVQDVVYDDICIRNSPNPITVYTDYGINKKNGKMPAPLYPEYGPATLPSFKDITLRDVRVSGGGEISFNGYSHEYRAQVNLDGVLLTDAPATKYTYSIRHADLHLGPGPVNLQLTGGVDSTITGKAGTGTLPSCASKFVPFPE